VTAKDYAVRCFEVLMSRWRCWWLVALLLLLLLLMV